MEFAPGPPPPSSGGILLIPGGIGADADAGNDDFDKIRISLAGGAYSAGQRRAQSVGGRHSLASNALAVGEFHKIDIGVAEIHSRILVCSLHSAVVGGKIIPHG